MKGKYRMFEAKVLRKQGFKITEIADRVGVSTRTIHNYLKDKVFGGPAPGRTSGSQKLKSFIPFVEGKLSDDLYLNGENLFEELQGMGYTGKTTILRDYLQKRRKALEATAVFRFETLPGHQAQVDWGYFGTSVENGIKRKRYLFVCKLGYSRRSFMVFTDSMEQSVLFACLMMSFSYFDGIPNEILFDNMKTAFLFDKTTGKWEVHPKLLHFSCHYGFTAKRCRVRRPQTKGKVEREIRYVRQSFVPRFKDMDEYSNLALNEVLLGWLKRVDTKILREFGKTRLERFVKDVAQLNKIPVPSFDYRSQESLFVNREGFFTLETNRYSVPAKYLGKTLSGLRDPLKKSLSVFDGSVFIREYSLFGKGLRKKDVDPRDRESLLSAWERDRAYELRRSRRKIELKRLRATEENTIQDPSIYDTIYNLNVKGVLS